MKKSLIKIFKFINQWHTNVDKTSGNKDLPSTFDDHKQMFLSNFQSNMERKIRLTDEQKLEMIKEQGGKSSLSKAPIYDWDEIEVDHGIPLAMGGEDKIENLGISHKQENRKKGSKLN